MSVNTGICNFSESVQHPFVRKMVMLSWRESAMVWYVVITSWGSFWFFSSLLRKGPSLKAIHCFIKTNSLRIKHKAILLKTHLLLSTQTNIQFAKCCSVPFLQHTLIFAIYWKALAPEQVFSFRVCKQPYLPSHPGRETRNIQWDWSKKYSCDRSGYLKKVPALKSWRCKDFLHSYKWLFGVFWASGTPLLVRLENRYFVLRWCFFSPLGWKTSFEKKKNLQYRYT